MTLSRAEHQNIYEEGRKAASLNQAVVVSPYLHDEERFAVWLEGYRSFLREPSSLSEDDGEAESG